MNARMGLKEFFAMEASEYLERLDGVVSAEGEPEREEFIRLARALRGSALMANEQQIGGVAAGLENLARAVRDERVAWDASTKQIAISGVDELKILVRAVGEWTAETEAKAGRIANVLNSAAGSTTAEPAPKEQGLDSGTRAFIARESATVASTLNQIGKLLQREQPKPEQLEEVAKVMQPLLGLASLPDLSPVPEVLDGVERAIAVAKRGVDDPANLASLFDAAARALTNAAQEITASGAARPDSPEAREFARRFGAMLDVAGEVVPIQNLYYDDPGPHILSAGTQPAAPGRLAKLELVAHGEHLKQAADELERAQWDTQREMRALALTSTFRSLMVAGGSPLENAVARFAREASAALTRGAPLAHTKKFAAYLREAGAVLSASSGGEEHRMVDMLTGVSSAISAIPAAPERAPAEPTDGPLNRPRSPSAEVPASVVDEPREDEKEQELETVDLVGSWIKYERLVGDVPPEETSLDDLIGTRAERQPPAVPEPEPAAPGERPGPDIIPISDLCYSGANARMRARAIRKQIREALARPQVHGASLEELVDELLDLVDLSAGHQE